jgi:hypothetical protein
MQGVFPKLVGPAAGFILSGGTGNGPGNLVQNGDDVDRQAAAGFRSARLPFEEVEPLPARRVHDDKVG